MSTSKRPSGSIPATWTPNTRTATFPVLSDVLEGKLGALGSRIGRLLFKLAVELHVSSNIIASNSNADLDTVEKVRGRCIKEVKRVNGEIKFEDALKYQKGWD